MKDTIITTTAPAVPDILSGLDYADTKAIRDKMAAVGLTADTMLTRWNAVKTRMENTTAARPRCLYAAYLNGNRRPMEYKKLKDTHATTGEDSKHYMELANAVYAAAVVYAAADKATRDADRSPELDSLFKALKEYFGFFTHDFTANGETATASAPYSAKIDPEALYSMISAKVTKAVAVESNLSESGISTRICSAITAKTTAVPAAFIRDLERHTVERLMDFDGIISRNAARDIRKANTAMANKSKAEFAAKLAKCNEFTAAARQTMNNALAAVNVFRDSFPGVEVPASATAVLDCIRNYHTAAVKASESVDILGAKTASDSAVALYDTLTAALSAAEPAVKPVKRKPKATAAETAAC